MLKNKLNNRKFVKIILSRCSINDKGKNLYRLRDASDAVSSQLIDAVQSAANLKVQLNEQLTESREQLKEAFSEIR